MLRRILVVLALLYCSSAPARFCEQILNESKIDMTPFDQRLNQLDVDFNDGFVMSSKVAHEFANIVADFIETRHVSNTQNRERNHRIVVNTVYHMIRLNLIHGGLNDIARESGFSARSLQRVFKEHGHSFKYIQQTTRLLGIRMEMIISGPNRFQRAQTIAVWGYADNMTRVSKYYLNAFNENFPKSASNKR